MSNEKKPDINDLLREVGPEGVLEDFRRNAKRFVPDSDNDDGRNRDGIGYIVADVGTVRRIKLIPFNQITFDPNRRRYRIKGLLCATGLATVWGPPKCGKSYTILDMMLHIALGWEYRGRRTHQGTVVYCAFEGQDGVKDRVEAFRRKHKDRLKDQDQHVPFYLQPLSLDLVGDRKALIGAINGQLKEGETLDVGVFDTVNRSLRGSESSDEDMGNYIKACDEVRETFGCLVILIHHCGHEGQRARGHSSLGGANDVEIEVKKLADGTVVLLVREMKDGESGAKVDSRLESVFLGNDADGDPIISCCVVPVEAAATADAEAPAAAVEDKLTPNQRTMFRVLFRAKEGLTAEEWNSAVREAGLNIPRRATYGDIRMDLVDKDLVYETKGKEGSRWHARRPNVDLAGKPKKGPSKA